MRWVCAHVLFLALFLPGLAAAQESGAREFKVSRRGDIEMSCAALSQEALLMREIIATTQEIRDESEIRSKGVGVAGALGSLLIGTATGGAGLAAAGYLINENVDDAADGAETVQDIAQQRRTFMLGIFNAKGCHGPAEHVMQDAPAAPLAEVEPAAGREPFGGLNR